MVKKPNPRPPPKGSLKRVVPNARRILQQIKSGKYNRRLLDKYPQIKTNVFPTLPEVEKILKKTSSYKKRRVKKETSIYNKTQTTLSHLSSSFQQAGRNGDSIEQYREASAALEQATRLHYHRRSAQILHEKPCRQHEAQIVLAWIHREGWRNLEKVLWRTLHPFLPVP